MISKLRDRIDFTKKNKKKDFKVNHQNLYGTQSFFELLDYQ